MGKKIAFTYSEEGKKTAITCTLCDFLRSRMMSVVVKSAHRSCFNQYQTRKTLLYRLNVSAFRTLTITAIASVVTLCRVL